MQVYTVLSQKHIWSIFAFKKNLPLPNLAVPYLKLEIINISPVISKVHF